MGSSGDLIGTEAGYGPVEQDYFAQMYPMWQGGGLGAPLNFWTQGPGWSYLQAWITGVKEQYKRSPTPGTTGFYLIIHAFQGYPVRNWVEKSREYVYP